MQNFFVSIAAVASMTEQKAITNLLIVIQHENSLSLPRDRMAAALQRTLQNKLDEKVLAEQFSEE